MRKAWGNWKLGMPVFAVILVVLVGLFMMNSMTACQKDVPILDQLHAHEHLLRASVTVAVVLTLAEHPEFAQKTYDIASVVASDTEDTYTSLNETIKFVKSKIDWGNLGPEEVVVVNVLLDAINAELQNFLRREGIDLPEEVQVEIRKVAMWVRDAAWTRLQQE